MLDPITPSIAWRTLEPLVATTCGGVILMMIVLSLNRQRIIYY
jgi:hypothetical protein